MCCYDFKTKICEYNKIITEIYVQMSEHFRKAGFCLSLKKFKEIRNF